MWILIFYVSSGFGSNMTGGAQTIENFSREPQCIAAGEQIRAKVSKFDWYVCIKADK